LGPEIFLDFMKFESSVMVTHCIKLDPSERFGKIKNITIKGCYIDWLVYFSEYKSALINLAKQKAHNVGKTVEFKK
jgi:hypothetical protein